MYNVASFMSDLEAGVKVLKMQSQGLAIPVSKVGYHKIIICQSRL